MQKRKINSEILDNSYKLRQSSSIIKLYDELHKKILENLIFIEDHEPLKIFRHTHQKWVESKKTLSNLDNKLTNEKGREYKKLEEIMNLVPRQI